MSYGEACCLKRYWQASDPRVYPSVEALCLSRRLTAEIEFLSIALQASGYVRLNPIFHYAIKRFLELWCTIELVYFMVFLLEKHEKVVADVQPNKIHQPWADQKPSNCDRPE